MPADLLRGRAYAHLEHGLRTTDLHQSLPELSEPYRGKVRDTYASGDRLVLVTTDRISAFDHVLEQPIPFKGQILNRLAAHFFAETADLVPNHVLSVPDPNVTVAKRCEPFPVEFVVRGYLAGHAWRVYRDGGRAVSGAALPDGLREAERLPSPILTPATKAEEGHDEDISEADIVARGTMSEADLVTCRDFAFRLFGRGTDLAAERGLLLVDTKYEFGRTPSGEVVVIDEVHTPDSSRYYYADGYEDRLRKGEAQRQLSKEFVREWLMAQGFQGKDGQRMPKLDDDFRVEVALRYAELFERMTGMPFQPDLSERPEERIILNLQ
jgi:phosphoribosylaminoimidazole-succinocarboxamide synthase